MRKWRIVSQEKTANNFRAKISLENGWMCHTDPSVEWAPGRKGAGTGVFEHRLRNQADPKLLGVSSRWCGSQG